MSTDVANFEPAGSILRVLYKSGLDLYKKKKREKILKTLESGALSMRSCEAESEEFIAAYLAT